MQNGIANGTAHMLQNGVAHLANGIIPSNNKVAPAVQNYLSNNTKDAVRKMYNEVEGYQQNLHMQLKTRVRSSFERKIKKEKRIFLISFYLFINLIDHVNDHEIKRTLEVPL